MNRNHTAETRTGTVYRFKSLTFYAIDGQIAMEDARDESFSVIHPQDFEERRRQLVAAWKRLEAVATGWAKDEARAYRRVIAEMEQCIREAVKMGDPADPNVQAYWKRHKPTRSFLVPGDAAAAANAPVRQITPPPADIPGIETHILRPAPRRLAERKPVAPMRLP